MAKGFTQTPGVDYDETFSPVDKIKSIRVMLALPHFMIMRYGKWMSRLLSLMGSWLRMFT